MTGAEFIGGASASTGGKDAGGSTVDVGVITLAAACTVMVSRVETSAPARSVAVTRIVSVPVSVLPGVPLKLRVVGSKLSQAGSAAPEA
jgi:hypothetical protein